MNIEPQNQLNGLLPNRIYRLATLLNILSINKGCALTIRDIIARHSSTLELNGRAPATAAKMIDRDLNDLINSGQVSTIGQRPRAFYKVISSQYSDIQNTMYRPEAANDDASKADIDSLALLNRFIKEPGVDSHEIMSRYGQMISESIDVIKQRKKADFFYNSATDKVNRTLPVHVNADLVGVIIRAKTTYLVSVSPSKRLRYFDIRGVSDFKAVNRKSHTILEEHEINTFINAAYEDTIKHDSVEGSPIHIDSRRQ